MSAFAPGQRWTYHTRPGEETSTLLILKCEQWPQGHVIHVQLDHLRLKNPHTARGIQETLPHCPFSEEAIRQSVQEKIAEGLPLPNSNPGYEQWRAAFDRGEAGWFTVPVRDILPGLEQV